MQVRRERVHIETARHRIVGTLQLPNEGYRSRTTDFLNSHENGFLALTDAEVSALSGGGAAKHEYVAVGARHIVVLMELETIEVADDSGAPGPLGR